jgi:type IV pilus biogenesis protein PilP
MSVMDKIKQLEAKQKVILGIVIILFIYLIYLAMDTFKGTSSTPAPIEQTPSVQPETTDAESPTTTSPVVTGPQGTSPAQQAPIAPVEEAQELGPTPEQLALLADSQEMQREYLKLVNEYQIAQLQEKLAMANAAIADAQFKSAETLAKTDALSQKAASDKVKMELESSGANKAKMVAEKIKEIEKKIQAIYVGKQRGSWVAMLDLDGSYFEVKVGTHLPDGSIVTSINHQGVVVTKDSSKRFLAVPRNLD